MLRVVRTNQGVAIDPRQVLPGRGAYVHHDAGCMENAVKRGGLARTLRAHVPPTLLTSTDAQVFSGAASKSVPVGDRQETEGSKGS